MRAEQGRIVIEPARPAAYSLADLVGNITKDNQHASIDTGPAVGGEVS